MSDSEDDGPLSRSKRFFKLASMTASVAGNDVKSRLSSLFKSDEDKQKARAEANTRSGERIAETLGELKGAVMKIGQMASGATDLLPNELAEPLEALQQDAPPMSFDVIADQIERELGSRPEMLFDDFDETPFASASIGQVHRAVTDDGREVVVKVQYPGVDEACDSDLDQLKFALRMSGMLNKAHRRAFDELFEEIREKMHEELDYTHEADNVRLFREMHADDDYVIIPEVVGERSAKRVLTLTFVDGDKLGEAAEIYDQETRNQIGENFFHLVLSELFVHRAVHADPNPGNFAFRPDGRIVLYDFGCVKKLHPDMATAYAGILRSGFDRDFVAMDEYMHDIGGRIPDGPEPPEDFYHRWYEAVMEPCVENRLFDFGEAELHKDTVQMVKWSGRYVDSFKPPVQFTYVNRVMGGTYNTLRKLGAVVPWGELVSSYVERGLE